MCQCTYVSAHESMTEEEDVKKKKKRLNIMKIDGGRLPTYLPLSLLHCPRATVVPAALIRCSQVSHLLTSSPTFSL